MKRPWIHSATTVAAVAAVLVAAGSAHGLQAPAAPSEQYLELYERVQMERVFDDGKTFADAVAKERPDDILADYRANPPPTPAALAEFVRDRFMLPAPAETQASALPEGRRTLAAHIAGLWPQLIRGPVVPQSWSTELPFGKRHVVPGGRFREIYYWDSYFTLLGLIRDGRGDVARDMVAGFAELIERYGHVPNGTRSYYLSRSQPPFFYLMVALLSPDKPAKAWAQHLEALRTEHAFWMAGEDLVPPRGAVQHVVALPDGSKLNRYWDRRDTPRDESWREDVLVAQASGRPMPEVYRELRSAAESGWDFSSRWLADGRRLETIETTAIVPVDLNSLLYGLERAIAAGCAAELDAECVKEYTQRARWRRSAIHKYLWDAGRGHYADYHWVRGRRTERLSAATLYPLFTGAAERAVTPAVTSTVRLKLLAPGGLRTTPAETGQQWDRPNGWAPLQWIAVIGLARYGESALAEDIARRWLRTVNDAFQASGKLVEKYDLEGGGHGGGGEYPLQDGFGWTNGVTRALLERYPRALPEAPAGSLGGEASP